LAKKSSKKNQAESLPACFAKFMKALAFSLAVFMKEITC